MIENKKDQEELRLKEKEIIQLREIMTEEKIF